jgi:outer membrane lipoprotein
MKTETRFILLWLVMSLSLMGEWGCQAAINQEMRAQADETVTLDQVSTDPEQYRGKIVLWGGEILEVRNTPEGAVLEILERPLDSGDRPSRREAPRGRFLITHKGFLDPAVYGRGLEITVVGEIVGKRSQTLDEIEYTYPVVQDRELVLWGPRRLGPAFHIGIGATIVR